MKSKGEHPTFLELYMYSDDELEPDKAESVADHLSVCEECSKTLEDIQAANEDILQAAAGRRKTLLSINNESGSDPLEPSGSTCRDEKLMSKYLEGRLSWRRRERYERHVEECNYCKLRLRFFLETEATEETPEFTPDEELFFQGVVDDLLKSRSAAEVRSWPSTFRQLAVDAIEGCQMAFHRFAEGIRRLASPRLVTGVAGRAALPIIFFLSLSSVIFIPLLYWLMSHFRYFNRTVLIMYAVFTPFIGVVFKGKAIFETMSGFLSGRERDKKRMNSIILLFYITLVIALNAPLLESIYTGMDMYGFFRFKLYEGETADMALIRGVMFSMLVNIVIATFSTVVLYVIHRIYLRRYVYEEETPYISSTFAMIVIPVVLAYVPVALFARRTVDVFIIELFLPIVVAFLACVGFSHPKNKLDLFQSKVLIFVCIAGIFIGVLAAAGLATLHLTNVIRLEIPDVWRSHVSQFRIDWESNVLGYPRDDYMSRWRNGFAWMVSFVAIYIVAGLGFFTTMTIMRYQYNYAAGKIKD